MAAKNLNTKCLFICIESFGVTFLGQPGVGTGKQKANENRNVKPKNCE